MLLIKSKQHVSKDNISRIKLTPVNSADEDQVELLEKVNVDNFYLFTGQQQKVFTFLAEMIGYIYAKFRLIGNFRNKRSFLLDGIPCTYILRYIWLTFLLLKVAYVTICLIGIRLIRFIVKLDTFFINFLGQVRNFGDCSTKISFRKFWDFFRKGNKMFFRAGDRFFSPVLIYAGSSTPSNRTIIKILSLS